MEQPLFQNPNSPTHDKNVTCNYECKPLFFNSPALGGLLSNLRKNDVHFYLQRVEDPNFKGN